MFGDRTGFASSTLWLLCLLCDFFTIFAVPTMPSIFRGLSFLLKSTSRLVG